jgi:hypothetical protein
MADQTRTTPGTDPMNTTDDPTSLRLDPDGYPPRQFVHDGRAVWPLGEDGDDGVLIEGHGPAACAALAAHEASTRRNPEVDALLGRYAASMGGLSFGPDAAIAGANFTERWAVFYTTCGCTQAEHDTHEDTWGGCDEHCANPDRPPLPPCTPQDSPYCWAWGFDWVAPATPGALPVTEVAWRASAGGASAADKIVSVPVRLTDGRLVPHCARTTVHPLLVIVPEIDEGEFTGGFTLAHTPTGRVLDSSWYLAEPLTPNLAGYAAALVAHLDWTSTSRDDYQGEHRQAWFDALNVISELGGAGSAS